MVCQLGELNITCTAQIVLIPLDGFYHRKGFLRAGINGITSYPSVHSLREKRIFPIFLSAVSSEGDRADPCEMTLPKAL